MITPVRIVHCPSCRTERTARRVAGTHVHGRPVDLLECTEPSCELVWAVRPDRPTRHLPAAA